MKINNFEILPKEKRKKLLLLSDDLRMASGVATMSREIAMGLLHRFDVVQLGAAIKHPDLGKIFDLSDQASKELGIPDAYLKVYPNDGYGEPNLLRLMMEMEKPDVIMIYTDPRFWEWFFNMEHEIRQKVPIAYYNIWDDLPYPYWNASYYESCDLIMNISKQTQNLVNNVLAKHDNFVNVVDLDNEEETKGDRINTTYTSYVPHGINSNVFKPISTLDVNEYKNMTEFKNKLFKGKEYEFVLFYNSRNLRRKSTSDIILAYKTFCDNLSKKEADKCILLLHTDPVDPNGTDLPAVVETICPNYNVQFSKNKIEPHMLNYLYNIADVTISMSSAEGFGLANAESIMAGTPTITPAHGGLQDQCGFVDEKGNPIKFTTDFPTNSNGKYKKHGEWCKVLFPAGRSLVGSPPTPYIFDSRVSWEDASEKIMEWYKEDKSDRESKGLAGREFLMQDETGMSAKEMCSRFIEDLEFVVESFEPKKRFSLIDTNIEKKELPTGICLTE